MIAAFPGTQPFGAAIWQKVRNTMDVILHIGAHRCATTSFQTYMRSNADALQDAGVGFWGPRRTRTGLFRGLQPGPQIGLGRSVKTRALGRVRLQCARTAAHGVHQLVVSDENMLGTMRANLRLAELYSGAGERMARFAEAFRDYLTDIVINIRSPELYWSSVLGYYAALGRGVPRSGLVSRLAEAPRSWRDVITDVACACPDARVRVMPFESFAGRPDAQLTCVTGYPAPRGGAQCRVNQTPALPALRARMARGEGELPEGSGRWMPFSPQHRAMMRETYADDLMWLAAGADRLARLEQNPAIHKAGTHLPFSDMKRGSYDERRHITVARAGREGTARKAG